MVPMCNATPVLHTAQRYRQACILEWWRVVVFDNLTVSSEIHIVSSKPDSRKEVECEAHSNLSIKTTPVVDVTDLDPRPTSPDMTRGTCQSVHPPDTHSVFIIPPCRYCVHLQIRSIRNK